MKVIRPLIAALLAALSSSCSRLVPRTPPRSPSRRTGGWWTVLRNSGERLQPWATIGICQAIERTPRALDDCGATAVGESDSTGRRRRVFRSRAPDARPKRRARGRLPRRPVRAPHLRDPGPCSTQPSCHLLRRRPHRRCARSSRRSPGTGRSMPQGAEGRRRPRWDRRSPHHLPGRQPAVLPARGVRHRPTCAAAHIHSGGRGENGDIVVALTPPETGGTSSGCVTVDPNQLAAIATLPDRYYVNIHTSAFPNERHPRQPHVGRSRAAALANAAERPQRDRGQRPRAPATSTASGVATVLDQRQPGSASASACSGSTARAWRPRTSTSAGRGQRRHRRPLTPPGADGSRRRLRARACQRRCATSSAPIRLAST